MFIQFQINGKRLIHFGFERSETNFKIFYVVINDDLKNENKKINTDQIEKVIQTKTIAMSTKKNEAIAATKQLDCLFLLPLLLLVLILLLTAVFFVQLVVFC